MDRVFKLVRQGPRAPGSSSGGSRAIRWHGNGCHGWCGALSGAHALVATWLVFACVSCAAVRQQTVPVPRAGEAGLRWPPLPVNGFVTRDGTWHDLAGGYMVESGDSLVFMRAADVRRWSHLTVAKPEVHRIFHRDSVASIAVRIEKDEPGSGAQAVGMLAAIGVVYLILRRGWPWHGF